MESGPAADADGAPAGREALKDAYDALTGVVGGVSELLARFRKRALAAEAQLREAGAARASAEAELAAERRARRAERDAAAATEAEGQAARRAAETALAEERAQRAQLESALVQAERRLAEARATGSAAGAADAPAGADAPADARETGGRGDGGGADSLFPAPADRGELVTLAQENAALRARLDEAAERTRALLERVRFLRQQAEPEEAR